MKEKERKYMQTPCLFATTHLATVAVFCSSSSCCLVVGESKQQAKAKAKQSKAK